MILYFGGNVGPCHRPLGPSKHYQCVDPLYHFLLDHTYLNKNFTILATFCPSDWTNMISSIQWPNSADVSMAYVHRPYYDSEQKNHQDGGAWFYSVILFIP